MSLLMIQWGEQSRHKIMLACDSMIGQIIYNHSIYKFIGIHSYSHPIAIIMYRQKRHHSNSARKQHLSALIGNTRKILQSGIFQGDKLRQNPLYGRVNSHKLQQHEPIQRYSHNQFSDHLLASKKLSNNLYLWNKDKQFDVGQVDKQLRFPFHKKKYAHRNIYRRLKVNTSFRDEEHQEDASNIINQQLSRQNESQVKKNINYILQKQTLSLQQVQVEQLHCQLVLAYQAIKKKIQK